MMLFVDHEIERQSNNDYNVHIRCNDRLKLIVLICKCLRSIDAIDH